MITPPTSQTANSSSTTSARPSVALDTPDILDISTTSARLSKLLAIWHSEELQHTHTRREARENKKNPEIERNKGAILSDEVVVPDRTINTNITREAPAYLEYLTKPDRLLVFTRPSNLPFDAQQELLRAEHEKAFTYAMRFSKWINPWTQSTDAMLLHGTGWIEVVFDETKPCSCALEYIPRDDLIMPTKIRDIQQAEILMRKYHITPYEAEVWAKKLGWNLDSLALLIKNHDEHQRYDPVHPYKIFLKKDNQVYVAWWHEHDKDRWLKPPALYTVGELNFPPNFIPDPQQVQQLLLSGTITPKYCTDVPIFTMRYMLTENEEVLKSQGRASLDLNIQEASTQLLTSLVNRFIRAAKFYVSVENVPGQALTDLDVGKLEHGSIHRFPIQFFTAPEPTTAGFSVLQQLSTRNAQEAGQTDFAALTRHDTEKTAHEIAAGQQEANKMSSAKIVLYSQTIVDVYTLCYQISASQAIIGAVKIYPPEQLPLLTTKWQFSAAGDIEITERKQKLQTLQQFFPILANTPLRDAFLTYVIQEFFPDEAPEWTQVLTTQPKLMQMIQTLTQILQGLPVQKMLQENELTVQEVQQLQQIIGAAQGLAGGPPQPVAKPPGNAGPHGTPVQHPNAGTPPNSFA